MSFKTLPEVTELRTTQKYCCPLLVNHTMNSQPTDSQMKVQDLKKKYLSLYVFIAGFLLLVSLQLLLTFSNPKSIESV